MKKRDRALTYSLLAHIRSKGQLVGGPVEVFVPLIKRTLSKLNEKGVFSGNNITEIKQEADELYSIDFPIPVLRTVLANIANEVNDIERCFELFQDGSFQIKNYTFLEFEEVIRIQNLEVENLENLFKDFKKTCGGENISSHSIFDFIEKNKSTLSKYLAHKPSNNKNDFSIEAQFVEYFKKVPPVYETIRKIYLGSILVSYLEYKTEDIKTNIELLIDTNFILGLLDLNTPESTHTCRKIIEITKSQGYRNTILKDTINETVALLKAKAQNFNTTFLQKKIYPEDIYNACDRRKLNSADLERIADNLEDTLLDFNITVIYETSKYKNIAKFSKEYEALRSFRHSDKAALHDATAIHYVREKRKKKIKDFENVNCWFINNSVSRDKYSENDRFNNIDFQPEIIKADDFLNIIWLSSPQIQREVNVSELAEIGLTSLVSIGINSNIPKLSIIRELDDNIQKYATEFGLSDSDILKIATRITTKQLTDLDNLNELARADKEKFVERLNNEAAKQKEIDDERLKKIDEILNDFIKKAENLTKVESDYDSKSKDLDEKSKRKNIEIQKKDTTINNLLNDLESERKLRRREESKRIKEKRDEFIGLCCMAKLEPFERFLAFLNC